MLKVKRLEEEHDEPAPSSYYPIPYTHTLDHSIDANDDQEERASTRDSFLVIIWVRISMFPGRYHSNQQIIWWAQAQV